MTMQSLAPMLRHAAENGYAVPQFNVDTLDIAQAVLETATEMRAPVILALGQAVDRAGRLEPMIAGLRVMAEAAPIPVCLHLDHSESLPQIGRALRAGCTGLMIDASARPLEENIAATRTVLELCAEADAGVEAELGRIAGVEDDLVVSEDEAGKVDAATVAQFLDGVRPDALAVAVGTAHGFYDAPPEIDFDLIAELASLSPPPLVLHGGTGLEDEVLTRCVDAGFAKMNFATELRGGYLSAVAAAGQDGANIFDALASGQDAIRRIVKTKLRLLRTADRAQGPRPGE
ncbi:tagatose-bisphosphate aldolase subunit KbaY [Aquicoccus sp. SCR17]|nr:tagatose-bisphosphate aldolase subunit KbaY [Carideicomes alvinocaridis]